MYATIRKRSGKTAKFNIDKIILAIEKAGAETGEFERPVATRLAKRVIEQAEEIIKQKVPTVEQIQDVAENVLLASKYKKTAKAYILYRDQHKQLRDITNTASIDLVDSYIGDLDWRIKENSNMGYSLQGLNNFISSEISKTYWLNKVYPKSIGDAHRQGDMHVHDLGLLSVYCVGWDLMDLLREGFKGVPGKVASKPAKHLRSALGQIVNFFYTLQGEAAGAQAFSNFDT